MSDVIKLQLQVGNFLHYVSRFIAGFAIGFSQVWQISLVTLSIVPLIAISGGMYAYIATGLIARVRKSYVKAGNIAEEVFFLPLFYFSALSMSWHPVQVSNLTDLKDCHIEFQYLIYQMR